MSLALSLMLSVGAAGGPSTDLACQKSPAFEDYPATQRLEGAPKPVDLTSHPWGRRFRTRLREASQNPADFAGFYTVAMWGCGTSCQMEALIDRRTGRVYFARGSALGVNHRLDSLLFIVNPPDSILEYYGGEYPSDSPRIFYTYYLIWNEGRKRFRLLCRDDANATDVAGEFEKR